MIHAEQKAESKQETYSGCCQNAAFFEPPLLAAYSKSREKQQRQKNGDDAGRGTQGPRLLPGSSRQLERNIRCGWHQRLLKAPEAEREAAPLSPENIFKYPNILEFLNLSEDTKTHKRDLDDRSLNSQQMRFVELVIDELSASGFIEPNALYESPFNSLHADGPEGLFAGKNNINDGLSQKLKQTQQWVMEG
jgi:hypothetical protein